MKKKHNAVTITMMVGWTVLGILFATQAKAHFGISYALAVICLIAAVLSVMIYRRENK